MQAIELKGRTMLDIDTSTEFGARVARHLDEDHIIWLTTVRADGRPEPSPVWFLWDGETVLVYSQPNTLKLRNIAARPAVSLNFNTDRAGEDMVVLTGTARIVDDVPPVDQMPAFVRKYAEPFAQSGSLSAEGMAREYSVAIRVTPTRVRGF